MLELVLGCFVVFFSKSQISARLRFSSTRNRQARRREGRKEERQERRKKEGRREEKRKTKTPKPPKPKNGKKSLILLPFTLYSCAEFKR